MKYLNQSPGKVFLFYISVKNDVIVGFLSDIGETADLFKEVTDEEFYGQHGKS